MYVADTGNHRIQILDENLDFIGELVTISSRDHMTYPLLMMAIMLLMYVADHGNNRIQVFTANDIVYSGPGGGAHVQATGAGGFIFAIQDNRLSKRTQAGELVKTIPDDGVAGDENLQFHSPEGIAVNTVTGRVYVADTGNNRIKALDADLNQDSIRQLPAHGVVPGDGNNQFRFPKGIAINTVTGRVYVADTGNHRIKVLDEDLNILSHYENDQFDRPHDISLAMVGNNVQMRVTEPAQNPDLHSGRHCQNNWGWQKWAEASKSTNKCCC